MTIEPLSNRDRMTGTFAPPEGAILNIAEEHYWKIHDEIKELHRKKGADYGTDDDPFANLRAAGEFGLPPWVGVALRMEDKMRRIKAFIRKGQLENESVEDSLLDLANYAMLGLALYREQRESES